MYGFLDANGSIEEAVAGYAEIIVWQSVHSVF